MQPPTESVILVISLMYLVHETFLCLMEVANVATVIDNEEAICVKLATHCLLSVIQPLTYNKKGSQIIDRRNG